MRIQVACVAADTELLVTLDVAARATVADALRSAAIAERTGRAPDLEGLAIFGKRVDAATRLRDGDRVEITRPLLRDPKTARRDRAAAAPADRPKPLRGRRSGI
jgi:putative ubiquitin-RnfH superfamily antitoxin RatB of RatAB toxin-antitoxin module